MNGRLSKYIQFKAEEILADLLKAAANNPKLIAQLPSLKQIRRRLKHQVQEARRAT